MAVGSVFTMRAEERGEHIVVIPQSGEQYTVKMADVDRITLGEQEMVVSTNSGQTKSYGYGDVDRILIGAKTDGILDITAGGNIAVWPKLVTSTLHIAGVEAGTPVKVFDMSGKTRGRKQDNIRHPRAEHRKRPCGHLHRLHR